MIRVLVADSSCVEADTLIAILSTDPEIQVIGVATTGKQAIDLVSKLRPDIVTISDSLEDVDSLEAIKHIMAYNPTPILILTDPDCQDSKDGVFNAVGGGAPHTSMGALDVVQKPTRAAGHALQVRRFVETVKLLSKVKVVTHLAGKLERKKRAISIDMRHETRDMRQEILKSQVSSLKKVVAIAASTGGPSALAEVLRRLPSELGIGIVIVQHVAQGFSAGLAEWLDRESHITVREARDGDLVKFGCAFLAPTGFHMVVKAYAGGNRIMLNKMPPVSGHRPSADVLFTSVAETYGRNSVGVILTGMGSDGASGIVAIKNAGGRTIVQDEKSCAVFGMPKAAIETGVVDEILPLDSIAGRLVELCGERETSNVKRET